MSKSKLSISSPTCSSLCLPRLRKWHHLPPSCSGQKTGRHPWIFPPLTTHIDSLPRLVKFYLQNKSQIHFSRFPQPPLCSSLCWLSPGQQCQPPACLPSAHSSPLPHRAKGTGLKYKSDPTLLLLKQPLSPLVSYCIWSKIDTLNGYEVPCDLTLPHPLLLSRPYLLFASVRWPVLFPSAWKLFPTALHPAGPFLSFRSWSLVCLLTGIYLIYNYVFILVSAAKTVISPRAKPHLPYSPLCSRLTCKSLLKEVTTAAIIY